MPHSPIGLGKSLVLIGGALPPQMVARHSRVSAAAAKWQTTFAEAIASGFDCSVVCLSYLPLDVSGIHEPPLRGGNGVETIPIPRTRGTKGTVSYAWTMLREIVRLRHRTDVIACYNPLIWTMPWAYLLKMLTGAPIFLIVADVDCGGVGPRARVRLSIQRLLLGVTRQYLVLSPRTAELLPLGAAVQVFGGLADPVALSGRPVDYSARLRFVYAGALTEANGFGDFVTAARLLVAEGRSCEFHVFGRGTPQAPYSDLPPDRFCHHGFVSDDELDSFLAEGCIGVNPRRPLHPENLYNAPFKLLFFLSRGMLTITTKSDGVPDDLAHFCVVCDSGSEGIAAACRSVLEMESGELTRLALAGREGVQVLRSVDELCRRVGSLLSGATVR